MAGRRPVGKRVGEAAGRQGNKVKVTTAVGIANIPRLGRVHGICLAASVPDLFGLDPIATIQWLTTGLQSGIPATPACGHNKPRERRAKFGFVERLRQDRRGTVS